jgi:hypothetical protein
VPSGYTAKSSETKRLMAEAEQAAKSGRDPRLAEWANLPAPDAVKMKPFLGSWQMTTEGYGIDVIRGLRRRDPHSVIRSHHSAGVRYQMDVQFVRVIADGTLQWGLRNGRGAGIILRTVTLRRRRHSTGTTEPVGIEQAPRPTRSRTSVKS